MFTSIFVFEIVIEISRCDGNKEWDSRERVERDGIFLEGPPSGWAERRRKRRVAVKRDAS